MTTFEALFCWSVLFLGLKVYDFKESQVRFYMTLGAILICLLVAISSSKEKTHGFQQRESSVPGHLRGPGSWAVLYGL